MRQRPQRRWPHRHRRLGQRGQVSVLIVGFAVLLAMLIALVTDATAAYLRRQSLDSLADGAALRGADLGATGQDVYAGGVPVHDLRLTAAQADGAVRTYLTDTGAFTQFPGLTYDVSLDPSGHRVRVRLSAPLHLPLSVPGSPQQATVGATGAALVDVQG